MAASKHPTNVLFLCSDQHARSALGCYGHPLVRTPNLDRLAAAGTRFQTAYTCSPICMPARASLATGMYVHQHRYWDSAEPYDGGIPGWAHRVRDAGGRTAAIGKLHYRSNEDDNGFDTETLTMHMPGEGWTPGLLRGRTPPAKSNPAFAEEIGWGESDYTHYDRSIADAACQWLEGATSNDRNAQWALFVSFVCPHNPFIAPTEFKALYPPEQVGLPLRYRENDRPRRHRIETAIEHCFDCDRYFTSDQQIITARAAYFGLCTFVDQQIGRVLAALHETGQDDRTTIIYTSDHGEMRGKLGYWGKYLMYEDSAGVPMIVAGPDIPKGETVDIPVSHVDIYPTILHACSIEPNSADEERPGTSLLNIANGDRPNRTIVSEYHDGGSVTGMFMIRHDHWKYIFHPGYPPQLFDLACDPDETTDLGANPEYGDIVQQCADKLREVVDPDAINEQAFSDQSRLLQERGGEAAILKAGYFGDKHHYSPVPVTLT